VRYRITARYGVTGGRGQRSTGLGDGANPGQTATLATAGPRVVADREPSRSIMKSASFMASLAIPCGICYDTTALAPCSAKRDPGTDRGRHLPIGNPLPPPAEPFEGSWNGD
jgi:hypothetical protein